MANFLRKLKLKHRQESRYNAVECSLRWVRWYFSVLSTSVNPDTLSCKERLKCKNQSVFLLYYLFDGCCIVWRSVRCRPCSRIAFRNGNLTVICGWLAVCRLARASFWFSFTRSESFSELKTIFNFIARCHCRCKIAWFVQTKTKMNVMKNRYF